MSKKQKSKEKMGPYGKVLASWKIPEFARHERGMGWYTIATLLGGGLIFYAVFTANFLFAIIILMLGLIMFLDSRKSPGMIPFQISQTGIAVGEKFTSYTDLNSFWIVYEPSEVKNLYLDFKSTFKPSLSVPLESQNPLTIRKMLKEYLQENIEREEESFADFVGRKFKI